MDKEMLKRVFGCIDNTTLSSTDTDSSVAAFCEKTRQLSVDDCRQVAAVCVYPRFVAVAKKVLEGSGIGVASVAGAFPHGQLPIELKVAEVREVIAYGADEVDMVLSRGALLEGDYDIVRAEVQAMKEACQGRTLKVILETCDLPSPTLIATASQLAIDGGADFIKTSTGKGSAGATLAAAETMLTVIAEHCQKTGRTVGFKAAGGISTPEEAVAYALLAQKTMGDGYVRKETFRIGASRLTNNLFSLLA